MFKTTSAHESSCIGSPFTESLSLALYTFTHVLRKLCLKLTIWIFYCHSTFALTGFYLFWCSGDQYQTSGGFGNQLFLLTQTQTDSHASYEHLTGPIIHFPSSIRATFIQAISASILGLLVFILYVICPWKLQSSCHTEDNNYLDISVMNHWRHLTNLPLFKKNWLFQQAFNVLQSGFSKQRALLSRY